MRRRISAAAGGVPVFRLRRPWLLLLLGAATLVAGAGLWYFWPSSEIAGLVYSAPDGVVLTLDLDYPAERRPPQPVVLFAPPEGAWPRALKWDRRFRALREALTGGGYVIATVHYRLPGRYPFPASIEDGKAAVRWLRRNAARYGLDGDHIGAIGISSGGYGVCMLGTTGPDDGFEGEDSDCSSRVQAVVTLGAPADFTTKVWQNRMESLDLRPFLQVTYASDPRKYARASPGTYATADDPPFLLFHSSDDLVVPVEMARSFADQLRRAGVPVELVEEEGVEHVWFGAKLERAIERTVRFFDRHLRPSAGNDTSRPDARPASMATR